MRKIGFANLKTGLLIEPHYLERQKFARQIPTFERLEKEAELDPYLNLEGKVEQYEACVNISDKTNENYFSIKKWCQKTNFRQL